MTVVDPVTLCTWTWMLYFNRMHYRNVSTACNVLPRPALDGWLTGVCTVWGGPQFVDLSPMLGPRGCFSLKLKMLGWTALHISPYESMQFTSLGRIPKSGIAGSQGVNLFGLLTHIPK